MTQDILLSKLTNLARLPERLEPRRQITAEQLAVDLDQQDIVLLNLERAIQTCIDIALLLCTRRLRKAPIHGGEAFSLLADARLLEPSLADRLRKTVGFRNLAVHEYTRIDYNIFCAILQQGLEDIKVFSRTIVSHIETT